MSFKCNLKCAGCGSWQVREHDDLSAEEWRGVFKQLTTLDIVKVLGGEPVARKDIVEILTGVREIVDPYLLQMTTNGMVPGRTKELIHAVAWPGLQLRISVDGMEATHDRMRGVEGSWQTVTRTVREVAQLQGKYGFKLGINFAVTDESIGELEDMLRFCEEVGADLIPGVNVDPFLVGTVPPEIRLQQVIMLEDPEVALAALMDSRVGTRRELPLVDHLVSRFLTKRTFQHQLHGKATQFPCRELRDLMYVLPNGDVVRCGMDHKPLGNVRAETIQQIWDGPTVAAARKKVDNCPGCLQASIQILSRVYGGCIDA